MLGILQIVFNFNFIHPESYLKKTNYFHKTINKVLSFDIFFKIEWITFC